MFNLLLIVLNDILPKICLKLVAPYKLFKNTFARFTALQVLFHFGKIIKYI